MQMQDMIQTRHRPKWDLQDSTCKWRGNYDLSVMSYASRTKGHYVGLLIGLMPTSILTTWSTEYHT
jgi:hypothetical protein